MLRAQRLTKVFHSNTGWLRRQSVAKTAVTDLSLEVIPGRITGLLGVNGAGKTTTIKMLTTLLIPTAGQITMDGIDVVQEPDRVRPLINMIAGGERSIYWRLTGRENLWYFGQLYDIDPGALKGSIESLLETVGLTEAADTPVERYSKGMKQRLQIARGLINDPRYLFMDEPTLGLDAPIARQLRRMTRQLADEHGRGILLTSHYMQEVEELCDYIYVIDAGKLLAAGTPAEITALTGGERVTRMTVSGWNDQVETTLRSALHERGLACDITVGEDRAVTVTVRAQEDVTPVLVEVAAGPGRRIVHVESVEPSLEDAVVAIAEGATEKEHEVRGA